jgi:GNAT superfamily N-acetyltransferase
MADMPLASEVVRIAASHQSEAFDCGSAVLNVYLQKYAFSNDRNDSARTFVVLRGRHIAGYFSIAAGSASHAQVSARIRQGLAQHPIPVLLIARLAVDNKEQGSGLGKALLKQALLKCIQAAEVIGARAVVVHAKDERAREFYERFGFEPSPLDPMHLHVLMKDVRKMLGVRG